MDSDSHVGHGAVVVRDGGLIPTSFALVPVPFASPCFLTFFFGHFLVNVI